MIHLLPLVEEVNGHQIYQVELLNRKKYYFAFVGVTSFSFNVLMGL